MALYSRPSVGPRKRQRRRARTAGTEPILCRVAAAPYPAYKTLLVACPWPAPA
ncbi:hypothetical protein LN650_13800 [Klebsiella pneumoniae subsp. pneumoniae]|nr:hypothetical protein [Klebsiella pneumoniae subsp. pneumoniae]